MRLVTSMLEISSEMELEMRRAVSMSLLMPVCHTHSFLIMFIVHVFCSRCNCEI